MKELAPEQRWVLVLKLESLKMQERVYKNPLALNEREGLFCGQPGSFGLEKKGERFEGDVMTAWFGNCTEVEGRKKAGMKK